MRAPERGWGRYRHTISTLWVGIGVDGVSSTFGRPDRRRRWVLAVVTFFFFFHPRICAQGASVARHFGLSFLLEGVPYSYFHTVCDPMDVIRSVYHTSLNSFACCSIHPYGPLAFSFSDFFRFFLPRPRIELAPLGRDASALPQDHAVCRLPTAVRAAARLRCRRRRRRRHY